MGVLIKLTIIVAAVLAFYVVCIKQMKQRTTAKELLTEFFEELTKEIHSNKFNQFYSTQGLCTNLRMYCHEVCKDYFVAEQAIDEMDQIFKQHFGCEYFPFGECSHDDVHKYNDSENNALRMEFIRNYRQYI